MQGHVDDEGAKGNNPLKMSFPTHGPRDFGMRRTKDQQTIEVPFPLYI